MVKENVEVREYSEAVRAPDVVRREDDGPKSGKKLDNRSVVLLCYLSEMLQSSGWLCEAQFKCEAPATLS